VIIDVWYSFFNPLHHIVGKHFNIDQGILLLQRLNQPGINIFKLRLAIALLIDLFKTSQELASISGVTDQNMDNLQFQQTAQAPNQLELPLSGIPLQTDTPIRCLPNQIHVKHQAEI
jgi:hypothetical protein